MNVDEAIKIRRAYRSLDSIEISDTLIMDLVEKAQVAPSCMNKQPWNFIFVKNREQLDKLFTTLSTGNKWVEKASLIIAVFSHPKNDCIIGEGCVIPRRKVIEANSLVLGVPGKIVGKISDEQRESSWMATKLYQTLPGRYFDSLKQL